ncbi:hypothetical protein [Corallococcus exercitus]|uniref:Uncharacterized protein n=1 Tax=Corallococcus exercitus TaxID=2316736 RepID=A0A7Y4JZZ7_9BACT|nr:hypothetical protein [Corallococcus exercitus]NOK13397.1 hypothetical protein [Corallococcus exercitus]
MSLRSAGGALGLVLLGMGLSHCKGDPDVVDAGVDAGGTSDAGPRVQTLMRDVNLLDVDALQQWLVVAERDGGGTVAQDLATGETRRIAPVADRGAFSIDGRVLVLTRSPGGGNTAWLWRPGDAEASVMGTQILSNVVLKEGANPYAAFVERTATGGSDLRRVFPQACDAGTCQVETLAHVEAESAEPAGISVGERFLWLRGTRATWAFDTEQGTLAKVEGTSSNVLRVSPSGDRFARLTPERNLRVYETRTQALLWEVAVPPSDGDRLEVSFFDEDTLIVGWATNGGSVPPSASSVACTSRGCDSIGATLCSPREVGGGAVLFCSATDCSGARCSASYHLMRSPGVTLSSRGGSIDREPAVSDDLSTVAWMTYELSNQLGTRTLLREQGMAQQRLTFPRRIDTTVFSFVPGQQRFVFVNPKQEADGGGENILSLWDEAGVEEVGVVEGTPFHPLFRTAPPALYLNSLQTASDGGVDVRNLQRFAL